MLAASGMVASAASGAASPSRPQATTVRLGYTCQFPSGPQRTAVQISATFPANAAADGPIQPTGVTLAVTFPRKGVADLVKRHASAVTASAELTLGIAQGDKSAMVAWPGLGVPETTVPRAASMTLHASGTVPPLIVGDSGNVTVTAGGLLLALTLRTASGSSPSTSRAASGSSPSPSVPGRLAAPPDVRIDCAPVAGQVATLATVAVAGAPGPAATSSRQAAAKTNFCPKQPKGGYQQNPRFPLPKPPPGSTIIFPSLEPGCAYTDGYADANKLNGAALLMAGLINIDVNVRVVYKISANYFQTDNYGQLSYHGRPEFPPSRATFLAFGFEPASATLHLIQIGTLNAVAIGPYSEKACKGPCPTVTTVSSYLYIRISNVTINGVPLNVGSDCGTAPFDAIVTGTSASNPPYSVTNGGPVTGTIDIPPFANCGVGEDLNPIFTASISGGHNASLLTQGAVCFLLGGGVCPPPKPKPIRSVVG
jgi:hypothetical protein